MFEGTEKLIEASPKPRKAFSDDDKLTGGGPKATGVTVRPDQLDSNAAIEIFHRLTDQYRRELDRQYENRLNMAEDAAFYDGDQWSAEDKATLEARGQKPLVYNVIAPAVDWVTGTERRARTDFKIQPRTKMGAKAATKKTQLLKYLSDVNREPFHISRAFAESVKVGVSWVEDGWAPDAEGEPVYTRYESWRNILWDSTAVELCLKDARYMFRTKWVDVDIAEAMFPKRKGLIAQSADEGDTFAGWSEFGDEFMDAAEFMDNGAALARQESIGGYRRQRVRLIEAWFLRPVTVSKMSGGSFAGEIFDPRSSGHQSEIAEGVASVVPRMTLRMHVAIMTVSGLLWLSQSPFRHNRFPFTPIWAHRRDDNNMPYGMIRRLKGIQDDVNKRAAKALHVLNTNKVIVDENTIPEGVTPDEFLEEASKPDALITKTAGSFLELDADRDIGQWHMQMMSNSIAHIQSASGVTDENMGRRTNATSGKAITARQEQGALTTALYFDNLLFANQVHGEKLLANTEQFMDEAKTFRITNMRGQADFVEVNTGLPDDDITRTKADFIISEADWQATIRQAAAAELMEVLSRFPPEVSLQLLDLVVDNTDLPNREEIVKRLRKMNGQRDPDATEPSPEELEAQQMAAAKAQLEARAAEARIAGDEGKAALLKAQAEAIADDVIAARAKTVETAIKAAALVVKAPPAADFGDVVLDGIGFKPAPSAEELAAAGARIGASQPLPGLGQAAKPAQTPAPDPAGMGTPAQPPTDAPAPVEPAAGA